MGGFLKKNPDFEKRPRAKGCAAERKSLAPALQVTVSQPLPQRDLPRLAEMQSSVADAGFPLLAFEP